MKSLSEIRELKNQGKWEELNEASLGRIYQHFEKSGKESYAILTSWRSVNSPSENKRNFDALRKTLRVSDLEFIMLKGHGMEVPKEYEGTPIEQVPKEVIIDTVEPSLFVPGMPYKLAILLMKKHDQDAIIFSGPDTAGKPVLIEKGGKHTPIGDFHPKTIARFYSEVKGKPFIFEAVASTQGEYMVEMLKRGSIVK